VIGWDADSDPDRTLLEEIPVGVTILDQSGPGSFVYANDRFLAVTGYTRKELLGASYRTLAGPETEAGPLRRIETAMAAGDSLEITLRNYRTDGTMFWNRLGLSPMSADEDDNRCLLVHRDITSQRHHQAALETLNRFAIRLPEATTVREICEKMTTVADDLFDFGYCMAAMQEGEWLVPRSAAGDVPMDLSKRLHLDTGPAGESYRCGDPRLFGDTVVKRDSSTAQYQSGIVVPIGDHGVFEMATTAADAYDGDTVALAELLASHTATAFDRLERTQGLERQNEHLQQFAHVISHDIRNPLSVLDGSLELARQTNEDEHFERANDAIERISTLVETLLTQARRGDQIGEVDPVDLVALSEACWTNVPTGNATLSVQTDKRLRADGKRLGQLLENLFRNAIEHGEAWQVTVGEISDGFYVADDGSGIPEADRDRIFESGYTTAADGTGFGLTICKQIAEAHGWAFTVTDSRDGGARFEISGVDIVADDR